MPTFWLTTFLNFCLPAEMFIFAIFSVIFDVRKKKTSALGRVIPCQDFLSLSDF